MATLASHPCRVIYVPREYDVSISGHGGEFVRGFWTSPGDLQLSSLELVEQAWQRKIRTETTLRFEHLWRPPYRATGM